MIKVTEAEVYRLSQGEATMKIERESDLPNELSKPAQRALVEAGYGRLEQQTDLSEAEVKQLHGVGPKAIG